MLSGDPSSKLIFCYEQRVNKSTNVGLGKNAYHKDDTRSLSFSETISITELFLQDRLRTLWPASEFSQ